MLLDFPPKSIEKIGAINIYSLQKIYELDSGNTLFKDHNDKVQKITKVFGNDELSNILEQLAIIIPIKNENLRLLEGVLCCIPNECLIIIVSNSQTIPVDRFSMEVETIKQYSNFADKKIIIIHQKDYELAQIFKKLKYTSILDFKGYVRDGKGEGMVIGILLAKMNLKQYIGFVDSDNYFPGSVNEYCKIFAAGFKMSSTPYSNIRVSWCSKPKIRNNKLQFPKYGRVSQISNTYLNALISYITGFETEIITTGNSGEHALSMPLAENLRFSSGYSVEPYEIINILEKFGGILPSDLPDIVEKGVEIFQIETRNPHFHEEKGKDHLSEMLEASLLAIGNSKICNAELIKEIKDYLLNQQIKTNNETTQIYHQKSSIMMDPIKMIPIDEFGKMMLKSSKTLVKI